MMITADLTVLTHGGKYDIISSGKVVRYEKRLF